MLAKSAHNQFVPCQFDVEWLIIDFYLSPPQLATVLVLSNIPVRPVEATVVRLFTDLLQNNVAGIPLIHKTEEFDFDPEVSKKRREMYYEVCNVGA